MVPKLIEYLESENDDVRLNAIVSLEGLIDFNKEIIKIKPYLLFLQKESEEQIKKEAYKIISRIAGANPSLIEPVMTEILELIIGLLLSSAINIFK